jgi:hypothetical protein
MGVMKVPIPGAKGEFVEYDTEKLPQETYEYALLLGLKALTGRGMSGKNFDKKDRAQVIARAKQNVEDAYAGKTRIVGSTATKVTGLVKTEAMRLAKTIIKDEIKRQGYKISSYEAKEITDAAKALLEQDPSIYETAEANIKARSESKPKVDLGKVINLGKAQVSKAPKKGDKPPLSAKQAGMIATRAKPTVQPHAKQ